MDDRFSRNDKPEGQEVRVSQDSQGNPVLLHSVALDTNSSPEARQALLRAAQATASFRHPQVLAVREVRLEGSSLIFVQDYPQGPLLADTLVHDGQMQPQVALTWMRQFAGALEAAQAKGLTLSQICPTEFVVQEAAHPGASGGLLCLCPPVPVGWWLEVEDPVFASPEQKAGRACDIRSSMYSAGAMLGVMTTGQRPLSVEGWNDVLSTAGLPPKATRAIKAVLDADPGKRCTSPRKWMDLLEQAAPSKEAATPAAPPRGAQTPARAKALAPSFINMGDSVFLSQTKSRARGPGLLPLLLVGVVAVIAFGIWQLFPKKTASPQETAHAAPEASPAPLVAAAPPKTPSPPPVPAPVAIAPPATVPSPVPATVAQSEHPAAVVAAAPSKITIPPPPPVTVAAQTAAPSPMPATVASNAPPQPAPPPAPRAATPPPAAKQEPEPGPKPAPTPTPPAPVAVAKLPAPAPAAPEPAKVEAKVEPARKPPEMAAAPVVPEAKPAPATPAPPAAEALKAKPVSKEDFLQQAAQATGPARSEFYRKVLELDSRNPQALHGLVEAAVSNPPIKGDELEELTGWVDQLVSIDDPLGSHALGCIALQRSGDARSLTAAIKSATEAIAQLKKSLHAGYAASFLVLAQASIELHSFQLQNREKPKADRTSKALVDEIESAPDNVPAKEMHDLALSLENLLKERAAKGPPRMQEAFLKLVMQHLYAKAAQRGDDDAREWVKTHR